MKSFVPLIAAAIACVLPSPSSAQNQKAGCTVRSGEYLGWKAQKVANRWVTLTFVPQLGGRLMQVEFNGHPYLFANPKYRGKYISPTEAKGDWINYGGDKIWPMPEGSEDEHHWVIQSTAIDDVPYRFETLSEGRECSVRLTGLPDDITGMRIVRTVTVGSDTPEIRFHAVMENATGHPITWSIQSVSQYDLADRENPSDFNHDLWAYTPRNPSSRFPDGMHVRYGLAHGPAFSVDGELFRLHWTWFGNEVWLDSTAGWLAVVDKSSRYGMVESFDVKRDADYPGKTTVIFYQNGPTVSFNKSGIASIRGADPAETPYYMEAEINSPMVTLKPGESYAFDTAWHPLAIAEQPTAMTPAGVVVQPLTAAPEDTQLRLKGRFSVFAPGKLVANIYNEGGARIGQREIRSVDPVDAVMLDVVVPGARGATRIGLKVIDESGKDLGTLSIATIVKG